MEVLVFSMVDMRRAKASATRLPGSSLAVVSSYSSGSTPEQETKGIKKKKQKQRKRLNWFLQLSV